MKKKTSTVKPVFKTTWEIGTTRELRTATSVPRSIHYIEMDLRTKSTSEFRTVLDSPLGVPNSQVPLYIWWNWQTVQRLHAVPLRWNEDFILLCWWWGRWHMSYCEKQLQEFEGLKGAVCHLTNSTLNKGAVCHLTPGQALRKPC